VYKSKLFLIFAGQFKSLTKLSLEKGKAQNGGGKLEFKSGGNLSLKLGGPEPKNQGKLRPILIPDLGDKSQCSNVQC